MLNAISVDVEEYFHAEIFRTGTTGRVARTFESRVEASVDLLLAMLDTRAKGTFFTLGEIAATHPQLVRKIAAHGHEIACHGDGTKRLPPAEFRLDIAAPSSGSGLVVPRDVTARRISRSARASRGPTKS